MTWAGETTPVENTGEVWISTDSGMLRGELRVPNDATGTAAWFVRHFWPLVKELKGRWRFQL